MPKVIKQKAGDPIRTTRLPVRCPACGRAETAAVSMCNDLYRVSCACGFGEQYQLETEG